MFLPTETILKQFGIYEGMQVADLGAGSGFYTYAISSLVGEAGRVYAVDIQKDLLARIKNEADNLKYTNIEIIWADLEKKDSLPFVNNILDVVILSNVFLQIKNKDNLIKEIQRILKTGRKVLVVDWLSKISETKNDQEKKLMKNEIEKLFLENNFSLEKEIEVGNYHFGLAFRKN